MSKHINRRTLVNAALLLSWFLALIAVNPIPAIADESEGGVQVSTTPVVSSIEVYDSDAYDEADNLTPNDEMFLNFTVTDPDLLANLTWVRVIVYDSSKAAWDDPVNHTELTQYFWVESTAAWNITEEGTSTWDINAGLCRDPGTDNESASFEFRLVFTPGKCAYEETSGTPWQFNITAYDDDALQGYNTTVVTGSWTGQADFYSELTLDFGTTSYNFSASSAGGANVSLYLIDGSSGTFLNFTVIANGVWDVACSATNWSKGGEWIDIDGGDVQYINDDDWDSNGEWTEQALTQTPTVYWDGDALAYNNTQESGASRDIYMLLAVPGGTTGGLWTQTLTVIAQNG